MPPTATDAVEARREFAMLYVSWFLSEEPVREISMPADIRSTHRWEVEFNSCVLDPARYVADTQYELSLIGRTSRPDQPHQ